MWSNCAGQWLVTVSDCNYLFELAEASVKQKQTPSEDISQALAKEYINIQKTNTQGSFFNSVCSLVCQKIQVWVKKMQP